MKNSIDAEFLCVGGNLNTVQVKDVVYPSDSLDHVYCRRVIRMAALCHDLGHLPFSHAAEKELLPDGWDHERLTLEVIRSDEMESI